MNLIKCGDGGMAPWCIACIHLKNVSEYVRIPACEDTAQDDFMCLECFKIFVDIPQDNLSCVCIHCVRKVIQDKTEVSWDKAFERFNNE